MPKKTLPTQKTISIDGELKRYSHYVWFLNTGYWPDWKNKQELIHHIDGDHQNDDFNNLTLMTNSEHTRQHHKKLGKWERATLEKLSNAQRPLQHRILRRTIPDTHPNRNVIFSQTLRRLKDKGFIVIEWTAVDQLFFLSTKEDFQKYRGIGEYEKISKNKIYPSSWFPQGKTPVARASERVLSLDHIITIQTDCKPDFVKHICLTESGREKLATLNTPSTT